MVRWSYWALQAKSICIWTHLFEFDGDWIKSQWILCSTNLPSPRDLLGIIKTAVWEFSQSCLPFSYKMQLKLPLSNFDISINGSLVYECLWVPTYLLVVYSRFFCDWESVTMPNIDSQVGKVSLWRYSSGNKQRRSLICWWELHGSSVIWSSQR